MSVPQSNGDPIIVLDGASSSGRTTLARQFALDAAGENRAYHIDEFVRDLPAGTWERCSGTDSGWAEMAALFHESLFDRWVAGERTVADCFFSLDRAREHLFQRLGRENVFLVQLFCEQEELERRERERGDRRVGLARSQFHAVYSFNGYDLRIDSTRLTPAQCAACLAEAVSGWAG